jgi:hypothetical protein
LDKKIIEIKCRGNFFKKKIKKKDKKKKEQSKE